MFHYFLKVQSATINFWAIFAHYANMLTEILYCYVNNKNNNDKEGQFLIPAHFSLVPMMKHLKKLE